MRRKEVILFNMQWTHEQWYIIFVSRGAKFKFISNFVIDTSNQFIIIFDIFNSNLIIQLSYHKSTQ